MALDVVAIQKSVDVVEAMDDVESIRMSAREFIEFGFEPP